MMHLGQPQCDWVTFLVECDFDLFQSHYEEEWKMCLVARLPAWAQKMQTRIHALGAGLGGRRRYTLSVWGESAQQVANLPFPKWADLITRYDVKRRLYDIREDTYQRLCIALQFAETRRNIEAFSLPKRRKNAARDSGGEGVRFGSRKSDISTKLSKRGAEIPYFETQIQDDRLDVLVLEAQEETLDAADEAAGWDFLLPKCAALQDRHIATWLRAAGIDKDIDAVRHEDIPMPVRLRKLFQLELWAGDARGPSELEEYGNGFDEVIDL